MNIIYHHRTASRDGQEVHISELVAALEGLGPSLGDHLRQALDPVDVGVLGHDAEIAGAPIRVRSSQSERCHPYPARLGCTRGVDLQHAGPAGRIDHEISTGEESWRVVLEKLAELQVPATLTAVLQARLDRLSPPQKQALQQAAVVGRVFWDAVLAELGAGAEVRLAELAGRELVLPRRQSAFWW